MEERVVYVIAIPAKTTEQERYLLDGNRNFFEKDAKDACFASYFQAHWDYKNKLKRFRTAEEAESYLESKDNYKHKSLRSKEGETREFKIYELRIRSYRDTKEPHKKTEYLELATGTNITHTL